MPTRKHPLSTDELSYAAWYLLYDLYGFTYTFDEQEHEKILSVLKSFEGKITSEEKLHAQRLVEEVEGGYWDDAASQFEDDYREDWREPIVYDEATHATWMQAVRANQSVEIIYDSITSGISKRIVDPYKTATPYGEGYCHQRQEVRKFRFDRIQKITLTNMYFTKPKRQ